MRTHFRDFTLDSGKNVTVEFELKASSSTYETNVRSCWDDKLPCALNDNESDRFHDEVGNDKRFWDWVQG